MRDLLTFATALALMTGTGSLSAQNQGAPPNPAQANEVLEETGSAAKIADDQAPANQADPAAEPRTPEREAVEETPQPVGRTGETTPEREAAPPTNETYRNRNAERDRDANRDRADQDRREGEPRAALGVYLDDQSPDGVIVSRVVPGSPAARMGIRSGDEIVSFNGQQFRDYQQFSDELWRAPLDEDARFVILRNGRRMNLSGPLGDWNSVYAAQSQEPRYSAGRVDYGNGYAAPPTEQYGQPSGEQAYGYQPQPAYGGYQGGWSAASCPTGYSSGYSAGYAGHHSGHWGSGEWGHSGHHGGYYSQPYQYGYGNRGYYGYDGWGSGGHGWHGDSYRRWNRW